MGELAAHRDRRHAHADAASRLSQSLAGLVGAGSIGVYESYRYASAYVNSALVISTLAIGLTGYLAASNLVSALYDTVRLAQLEARLVGPRNELYYVRDLVFHQKKQARGDRLGAGFLAVDVCSVWGFGVLLVVLGTCTGIGLVFGLAALVTHNPLLFFFGAAAWLAVFVGLRSALRQVVQSLPLDIIEKLRSANWLDDFLEMDPL